MTVRAARNTHYSFAPGSAQDARFKSLAFRFDLPGRAIAYTGDTGPSPAVAKLASGADLLVTEMIDVDRTMADVRRVSPGMPAPALAQVEGHLRAHHLTPGDVGDLAAAAQVKAVAITHFVAPHADATVQASYLDAIRAKFPGKVTIASDLQEF
jgi:ribonuclease BN (tRNA processing enzyme)